MRKQCSQAGSDFLAPRAPEEIFYQDFKSPSVRNGVDFGVGQISAMTQDELEQVKDKLLPYLEQAMNERKIEMVFVMLTNIIEETTFLICAGEKADALMEAFHVHKTGDYHILKEVVSRKKQLIPMFMSALQEQ
ncbi:MAG: DHHA2 domain-containing protein [Eubacterium sp.]